MNSNENIIESDSAPNLGSTDIKFVHREGLAREADCVVESAPINENCDLKLQDLELGQKRKNFENCIRDMEKEDSIISSKSNVKRRRYSNTQYDNRISNNNMVKRYTLLISNTPGEWSSEEVIDYVKDKCKVIILRINDCREESKLNDYQIQLKFETKEKLEQVFKKLKDRENEGKLSVQINDIKDDLESDEESEGVQEMSDSKLADLCASSTKLDEGVNDYHIRTDFLDSLGIEPPITNRVTVTNFRCDKSELKEVLELAGRVLICSVCTVSTKYASVMYSHPLEAVQAVSMLHGRKLYGQALKITMNTSAGIKTLLPKGLVDVGPGLGKFGKPVPDLGEQYKRFTSGKTSNIEACIFQPSLLNQIGITSDEVKFAGAGSTSNNPCSQNEITDNVLPTDKEKAQKIQGRQFGAVGQEIPSSGDNIPVIQTKNINRPMTNKLDPRGHVSTPVSGPTQTPLAHPPMGLREQLLAGPVVHPRAPGFPMLPNAGPTFPSIPGVETDNGPQVVVQNGMMSGPMPTLRAPVPRVPMAGFRGAMVGPNRFPGPGNPMLGPRPVGPVIVQQRPPTTPNGPMIPNHQLGVNVRLFKGLDPVLIQMSNLPPTTTFVTLGQKLAEFGHVLFLELTTPGCANVRFANPADADRCLQNFHNVMG